MTPTAAFKIKLSHTEFNRNANTNKRVSHGTTKRSGASWSDFERYLNLILNTNFCLVLLHTHKL